MHAVAVAVWGETRVARRRRGRCHVRGGHAGAGAVPHPDIRDGRRAKNRGGKGEERKGREGEK